MHMPLDVHVLTLSLRRDRLAKGDCGRGEGQVITVYESARGLTPLA